MNAQNPIQKEESEKQEPALASGERQPDLSSERTGSVLAETRKKEKKKRALYKSRKEKFRNLPVLNVFQWTSEQICAIYGENWTLSYYEYHDRTHVIPAIFYRAHIVAPVICTDGQMVRLPLQNDLLPKSDSTADYGAWLVSTGQKKLRLVWIGRWSQNSG